MWTLRTIASISEGSLSPPEPLPSWRGRHLPAPRDVPRQRRRGGRGLHHRARGGRDAWLAVDPVRRRRRLRGAGGRRGGAGPGGVVDPDPVAERGGRWAAAGVRPAVAAQGDPAGRRLQGAARRGGRVRGGTGRRTGRGRIRRRLRLLRLHGRVQGRSAGGSGGGVHRRHLRREPRQHPARRGGCGCGGRGGAPGRRCGAGTAGGGAGEHAEVRGGAPADDVRDVLGRRGRRCFLARRRRRDPRAARLLHRHVPAARAAAPGAAGSGGAGVRSLGRFLYDFVVGDDPVVAVLVVVAIAAAWLLHDAGADAWWVVPAVVTTALGLS